MTKPVVFQLHHEHNKGKMGTFATVRVDPTDLSRAVGGGRDNHLSVWDLERAAQGGNGESVTWRARNLPDTKLSLPPPVWVTDAAWASSSTPHTVVAVTAYADVQVYDVRVGGPRRPVRMANLGKVEERNRHLTVVAVARGGSSFVVADNHGAVAVLEAGSLREEMRLPGCKGSVRSLAVAADRYVVTGGLDRWVRVYDVEAETRGKRLLGQAYVKQGVVGVLALGVGGAADEAGAGGSDDDDEDDEEEEDEDDDDFESWVNAPEAEDDAEDDNDADEDDGNKRRRRALSTTSGASRRRRDRR